MENKNNLKPFGHAVQICPVCGKVDVFKDDGHSCEDEAIRQNNLDYYD